MIIQNLKARTLEEEEEESASKIEKNEEWWRQNPLVRGSEEGSMTLLICWLLENWKVPSDLT